MLWLHYLVCSPGYFKDSTTNECKACPKGTFSDEVDATSCASCPEGQTTSGDGNTECREGKEKKITHVLYWKLSQNASWQFSNSLLFNTLSCFLLNLCKETTTLWKFPNRVCYLYVEFFSYPLIFYFVP